MQVVPRARRLPACASCPNCSTATWCAREHTEPRSRKNAAHEREFPKSATPRLHRWLSARVTLRQGNPHAPARAALTRRALNGSHELCLVHQDGGVRVRSERRSCLGIDRKIRRLQSGWVGVRMSGEWGTGKQVLGTFCNSRLTNPASSKDGEPGRKVSCEQSAGAPAATRAAK